MYQCFSRHRLKIFNMLFDHKKINLPSPKNTKTKNKTGPSSQLLELVFLLARTQKLYINIFLNLNLNHNFMSLGEIVNEMYRPTSS